MMLTAPCDWQWCSGETGSVDRCVGGSQFVIRCFYTCRCFCNSPHLLSTLSHSGCFIHAVNFMMEEFSESPSADGACCRASLETVE